MKTFIYVRDSDKAVVGVGMIHKASGGFTSGVQALIEKHGSEDAGILAEANRNCPTGCTPRIVDTADLPGGDGGPNFEKLFFRCNGLMEDGTEFDHCGWTDAKEGQQVDIELSGAKNIAHMHRRVTRQKKMEPLDREEGFASTSKTRKTEIANEKQAILSESAAIQTAIDEAADESDLRAVVESSGIVVS